MKYFRPLALIAVVLMGLMKTANAATVELQSVSRIAFGPDNTLFVADWKAAQIIAVTLPAATDTSTSPFNLMDFEDSVCIRQRNAGGQLQIFGGPSGGREFWKCLDG